jgi:hypothetical protein
MLRQCQSSLLSWNFYILFCLLVKKWTCEALWVKIGIVVVGSKNFRTWRHWIWVTWEPNPMSNHIKCGQVREWHFQQSEWFNTCTVVENTSHYPYYTNNKGVTNDNVHSSQMEGCVYLYKKLPCGVMKWGKCSFTLLFFSLDLF